MKLLIIAGIVLGSIVGIVALYKIVRKMLQDWFNWLG